MCAALTQGKRRMRGEGVPRALEGVKGLWPHERGAGWGGGGGEDEQADGDGMRDHLDMGAGDGGMG